VESLPNEAQTKTCPQCAEEVKAGARICRFCSYSFEPVEAAAASPAKVVPTSGSTGASAGPTAKTSRSMLPFILVGLVLAAVVGGFAFVQRNPSPALSDAASIWCRNGDHLVAMNDAAARLGIDIGDVYLAGHYLDTGQTPSDKLKDEFARTCNAAFGSR
jgi:hypothetical protein